MTGRVVYAAMTPPEVRRLARGADNDFNPVFLRILCECVRFVGRAVRGDDADFRFDPELFQRFQRGLYYGEIGFTAH